MSESRSIIPTRLRIIAALSLLAGQLGTEVARVAKAAIRLGASGDLNSYIISTLMEELRSTEVYSEFMAGELSDAEIYPRLIDTLSSESWLDDDVSYNMFTDAEICDHVSRVLLGTKSSPEIMLYATDLPDANCDEPDPISAEWLSLYDSVHEDPLAADRKRLIDLIRSSDVTVPVDVPIPDTVPSMQVQDNRPANVTFEELAKETAWLQKKHATGEKWCANRMELSIKIIIRGLIAEKQVLSTATGGDQEIAKMVREIQDNIREVSRLSSLVHGDTFWYRLTTSQTALYINN